MLISISWPLFVNALQSGEMSSNAGGLIRWPVYLLLPTGMSLLLLQCFSELVKRIAFLMGMIPDPLSHKVDSGETVEKQSETNQVEEC
jgi:TRAP-type mannitol/chloroaromatic compound transport system permease small subunit